jgi:pSer/pThr/pTyr-binding forkhead associated (FHA) protein
VPVLIAKDGPLRGERIEIGSELYVGRSGQQLNVEDLEISRRHALIRAANETVTIEDLGSRNGTFVNEQRIEAVTTLRPGDVVRLGTTSFELEGAPAPATSAVATPPPSAHAIEQPFGSYAAARVTGRRRSSVASRQLLPELITILAVVATAIALVLYFGLR